MAKYLVKIKIFSMYILNQVSVQFSRSVVSDSLRPHESQHARPPCPSPTPGVYPTHVHQVSDAIQPSHPLSSPSPPSPNLSQHQGLFQWTNSSHEVAKLCIIIIQSWKRLFYLLLADTYKCINCISFLYLYFLSNI